MSTRRFILVLCMVLLLSAAIGMNALADCGGYTITLKPVQGAPASIHQVIDLEKGITAPDPVSGTWCKGVDNDPTPVFRVCVPTEGVFKAFCEGYLDAQGNKIGVLIDTRWDTKRGGVLGPVEVDFRALVASQVTKPVQPMPVQPAVPSKPEQPAVPTPVMQSIVLVPSVWSPSMTAGDKFMLSGSLYDLDGSASVGTVVSLSLDERGVITTTTDANGMFAFTEAVTASGLYQGAVYADGSNNIPVRLEVSPAAPHTVVAVVVEDEFGNPLQAGAQVTGTVTVDGKDLKVDAKTALPAPPAPKLGIKTVVVKAGDSLWTYWKENGKVLGYEWDEFKLEMGRINGLGNPNIIITGSTLVLPAPAAS